MAEGDLGILTYITLPSYLIKIYGVTLITTASTTMF